MQPPPPPSPVQPAGSTRTGSRLLGIAGVTLGLAGLVAGVGAWFRAAPPREATVPAYSEQQVIDATKTVCDAYSRGLQTFRIAAGRQVENPADKLPVAVNTRVAEIAVSNFLSNEIYANPAAPLELQKLVHQLSEAYQDIALVQLAEGTTSDVEPFGLSADDAIAKIGKICP